MMLLWQSPEESPHETKQKMPAYAVTLPSLGVLKIRVAGYG